jgi:hypothetical protein
MVQRAWGGLSDGAEFRETMREAQVKLMEILRETYNSQKRLKRVNGETGPLRRGSAG